MVQAARAAVLFGFSLLLAFQIALAAGAPLGEAAWGGSRTDLTTAQRLGSAVSALFYVLAIFIVRRRTDGRVERRYRWGIRALVVILAVSGLINVASSSRWENFVLGPAAFVLAGLCFIVARAPIASAATARPVTPNGARITTVGRSS